ncbi:MAG: DUF2752 domain-containing protein [Clostridia bacterium]
MSHLTKRWIIVADVAFVLAVCAVVFFWRQIMLVMLPCPLYSLTGCYCVGCGATRMFMSLKRLDIVSAFGYNALVFLIIVYLTVALIACNVSLISGKNVHKWLVNRRALWIIAIATILFGILRNIPIAPFSYLAP